MADLQQTGAVPVPSWSTGTAKYIVYRHETFGSGVDVQVRTSTANSRATNKGAN